MNQSFEQLIALVENTKDDAAKFFEKENKSAGTRVRAAMSEISKLTKQIRKEVQDKKATISK